MRGQGNMSFVGGVFVFFLFVFLAVNSLASFTQLSGLNLTDFWPTYF